MTALTVRRDVPMRDGDEKIVQRLVMCVWSMPVVLCGVESAAYKIAPPAYIKG